jgi:predicted dehydrogenase
VKRRVILVGAGGMGRRWAKAILARADLDLAGWVDVVRSAADKAAADLGVPDTYVDDEVGRAISTVSPDFLVDVTVPAAHYPVTLAALERGVPVLGEKPMTDTLDEARLLIEASERTGTLFVVSQSRRYNAQLAALRALIDDELGAPELVSCQFFKAPHFGGFRDEMPSPLLEDMAIHSFDAARWLVGADPVAVYCEEYNPSWSWYRGDACATAVFEFDNGARLSYAGSWCAEGAETSWEGSWRVATGRGSAVWDGFTAPFAELVEAGREPQRVDGQVAPDFVESVDGSLADFVAALDGGPVPMGECHDNVKSLAMAHAAVASSAQHARIPVQW